MRNFTLVSSTLCVVCAPYDVKGSFISHAYNIERLQIKNEPTGKSRPGQGLGDGRQQARHCGNPVQDESFGNPVPLEFFFLYLSSCKYYVSSAPVPTAILQIIIPHTQ
jgi:hypothetical protein